MSLAQSAPDAPAWFDAALDQVAEVAEVPVEDVAISYRSWGRATDGGGENGIVLIHGGAAHARWWDHLAPMLAGNRRVVALDLSGHGDSGHRPAYTLAGWAREVMAVAAASFAGPPIVIGHSMGGMVALHVAAEFGSQLAGTVVIDTPVRSLTPEEAASRSQLAFSPRAVYATRAEVVRRFRVIPDQPTLPYIFEHIAETSVRKEEDGWTWKFDPQLFAREPISPDLLTRFDCRMAVFRAEHGIVPPDMGQMIFDRLGRVAPLIEIPAAGHHVMLDEPLALMTGLRTLLADWEHSTVRQ